MGTKINEVGNRYGRLTVLKETEQRASGAIKWLCQCDCGEQSKVSGAFLRNGMTKSCGCLQRSVAGDRTRLALGEAASNDLFRVYRTGAQKRNLAWELTKAQFLELTQRECYLCRALPEKIRQNITKNSPYIYNGIDRVDNTKGYTSKNCRACCEMCNRMKSNWDLDSFLSHINLISGRTR